jgi:hypothetical protein
MISYFGTQDVCCALRASVIAVRHQSAYQNSARPTRFRIWIHQLGGASGRFMFGACCADGLLTDSPDVVLERPNLKAFHVPGSVRSLYSRSNSTAHFCLEDDKFSGSPIPIATLGMTIWQRRKHSI